MKTTECAQVQLCSLLTSVRVGRAWLTSPLGLYALGKQTPGHCQEGWVVPRVGLDGLEKRREEKRREEKRREEKRREEKRREEIFASCRD
jgi:hypothetical protein